MSTHPVDGRATLVVHLPAPLVDLGRRVFRAIDGRLTGLEFLALLYESARLFELSSQLFGTSIRNMRCAAGPSAATDKNSESSQPSDHAPEPGKHAFAHGRRCYTPLSSCLATRPSLPERAPAGEADSDRGKEVLGSVVSYEVLLMLEPDVAEERQSEIVARMRELVERGGGAWSSHDLWGRRKLAYEIDHTGEGVYHLVTFDAEAETLDELSRILKITDGVMRHLAVRRVPDSRTDAPPPLRVAPPSGEQAAVPATGYASNTRSQGEE